MISGVSTGVNSFAREVSRASFFLLQASGGRRRRDAGHGGVGHDDVPKDRQMHAAVLELNDLSYRQSALVPDEVRRAGSSRCRSSRRSHHRESS
jgi:hypothetical protein